MGGSKLQWSSNGDRQWRGLIRPRRSSAEPGAAWWRWRTRLGRRSCEESANDGRSWPESMMGQVCSARPEEEEERGECKRGEETLAWQLG